MVLDGSSSIDSRSWNEVIQFALDLMDTMNVSSSGSHVGTVQFSDYARVEEGLLTPATEARSDIQRMRKMDLRTAIAQGINAAQQELDQNGRASVPHTIVLMTDGVNNEPGSPLAAANAAKAKGSEVFVIGVGPDVDPTELKPLASDPLATHYYTPTSFAELQDVLRNMSQYTCDFYKCQDSTGTCQIVPRGTAGATSEKECENTCQRTGGDYVCNVELLTCEKSAVSNGTDLATCQEDCQVHTPAVLIGSWRGVEIDKSFKQGEIDLTFTADNVTFSNGAVSQEFKVRANGSELTLIDVNGNIRKANYGVVQGPVTMYATFALGPANSTVPILDFDTSMDTVGYSELALVSCLGTSANCNFAAAAAANTKEQEQVRLLDDDATEEEVFDLEFGMLDPQPSSCSQPADAMFVIDGSGSITPADWQQMRDFASNITNDLNVTSTQAHVGVYEFSGAGQGRLVDKLDDSKTSVDAAIAAMTTLGGRTAIGDGIKNAQAQLAAGRAGVPRLMILMTDGVENEDTHPIQEAVAAKAAGTEIVVLAIGSSVDLPSLAAIASLPTATHLFTPSNYAELQKYVLSVLDTVCPQPIYMCQQNTTAANDTPTSNGTCVQVAPGTPGATSLSVCNQTCSGVPPVPPIPPVPVDKYMCDNQTLTCKKVNETTPGAQTMQVCNQTCGHKAPIALTGEWRGVEISTKFERGEWDLNITEFDMTLRSPSGAISYGYVLAVSPFQFGIDYQKGAGAGQHSVGMFLPADGPETEFITLALTLPGTSTLPASFDACMTDSTTFVLNMVKCLPHKACDFASAMPAPPTH